MNKTRMIGKPSSRGCNPDSDRRRYKRQTKSPVASNSISRYFNDVEGRILVGRVSKLVMLELIRLKNRMGKLSSLQKRRYKGRSMFEGIGSTKSGRSKCGAWYTMFQHWSDSTRHHEWMDHPLVSPGGTEEKGTANIITYFGKHLIKEILRRNISIAKSEEGTQGIHSNGKNTEEEGIHILRPGLIITLESFPQIPHCDFVSSVSGSMNTQEGVWVLHLPLCVEGAQLNVWGTPLGGKRKGSPLKVFIPFGSYILLRGDVTHGGCFGRTGNVRFHMVLYPIGSKVNGSRLEFDHSIPEAGLAHNIELKNELTVNSLDEDNEYVENLLHYAKCEFTGASCIESQSLDNLQW